MFAKQTVGDQNAVKTIFRIKRFDFRSKISRKPSENSGKS